MDTDCVLCTERLLGWQMVWVLALMLVFLGRLVQCIILCLWRRETGLFYELEKKDEEDQRDSGGRGRRGYGN